MGWERLACYTLSAANARFLLNLIWLGCINPQGKNKCRLHEAAQLYQAIMKTKSSIAIIAALALLITAVHAAVFTTNATIAIGVTTYDGQDIVVSNCTLTVNGAHNFASLQVISNAVLAHSAAPNGEAGNLLSLAISGNLGLDSSSEIDVSGQGYAGGAGPGAGTSYGFSASGAGHGGTGGLPYGGGGGGGVYDSVLTPSLWGSGGGNGYYADGGAGGGVICLAVAGTLQLDGVIAADGVPGGYSGGGGAGGSIQINAGTLAGSGLISAQGGSTPTSGFGGGGGGGGGRIAIYGTISSVQSPIIALFGGSGGTGGGLSGSYYTSTTYVAPMVIAQSPSGQLNRFVSYMDVTFNQPVDPGTFTNTDLVLTTPSGSIPASQITLASGDGSTWRIGFPTQTANGDYSLTVGPHVANLFGQEMPSAYQGAFNIQFTPTVFSSSLNGTNFKLSWPTVAGLNYQLQSTTNLSAASWVNEGAPFTGTGGALTNTISVGADSGKFFRLLLLEN
jgi:hypothetical protein